MFFIIIIILIYLCYLRWYTITEYFSGKDLLWYKSCDPRATFKRNTQPLHFLIAYCKMKLKQKYKIKISCCTCRQDGHTTQLVSRATDGQIFTHRALQPRRTVESRLLTHVSPWWDEALPTTLLSCIYNIEYPKGSEKFTEHRNLLVQLPFTTHLLVSFLPLTSFPASLPR